MRHRTLCNAIGSFATALGASIAFLPVAGCQTESRPSAARPTTAPADDNRDAAANVMADDDTERAKQAAIENRNRSKPGRPVTPDDRSGTRVVDQPRVGGRP